MVSKIVKEDIENLAESLIDLRDRFENKTFLITGAGGFLGNYMVLLLKYLNDHVLTNPASGIFVDKSEIKNESRISEDHNLRFIRHNVIEQQNTPTSHTLKKRQAILKNILLTFMVITFCVGLLEFSPYIVYLMIGYETFDNKEIQGRLSSTLITDTSKSDEVMVNNKLPVLDEDYPYLTLHPYLGFAYDPGFTEWGELNSFGFVGKEPIIKKTDGELNVLMLGGSVAERVHYDSYSTIVAGLEQFSSKKINFVLFAAGGYKQPQHLLALTYLLSLGSEYDIVINLDGFNEVALPFTENIPFNVNPFYPRLWHLFVAKGLNLKNTAQIGLLYGLRKSQLKWKSFFATYALSNSNFSLAIWDMLDYNYEQEILFENNALIESLADLQDPNKDYGPDYNYEDELQLFVDLAEKWKIASLQLSRLCKANDIMYFHFLQPNQYFEGSKKLSKEEERTAFVSGPFKFKKAVHLGYPLLIKEGEEIDGSWC